MFELGGRIGFGVDVRYFLELQRALHRDGMQRPAAHEQRMRFVGKTFGERADGLVQLQVFLDQVRQLKQLQHQIALVGGIAQPMLRERNDQHPESGQLGGERLREGNSDFRARPDSRVPFAASAHLRPEPIT